MNVEMVELARLVMICVGCVMVFNIATHTAKVVGLLVLAMARVAVLVGGVFVLLVVMRALSGGP